jgi:predicted HTH transcriptional regulator
LDVLSKSDKVLALIRQWESKTVEFKQTLKMNIKTNQKDKEMERACLKTIVAFLNSDWWNLIIWVKDDGEIYWIDNDDYKSNDDYLKHFHNLIRDKIGEEFFPLINYHIVDINQKKILLVECGMSDTACYYEGKEFFVRTNPATDKLEWPKLVEYVGRRFKNK